jgi:DNA-binding transcriptional LysR family regulator
MLDVARLRVFREVAARGSFTAAANALHYSQPAVSHHVARLEEELGVQLLLRRSRGLALTPAGEEVLRHAEAVLERLDEAERDLAELAASAHATVRLAAFPSACTTLVPEAVAALARRYPEITLDVTQADPVVALPGLLEGRHDLVLAYDYPVLDEEPEPEFEYELLFEDHLLLALPAGHALTSRATADLADLADADWVTPNPCPCRDAIEAACEMRGFEPHVVSQTNDYLAMQGFVAAGMGVALIPRLAVAAGVREGVVLRPIEEPALIRTTSIVRRANGHRPLAAEPLREVLRELVPRLGARGLPLGPAQTVEG